MAESVEAEEPEVVLGRRDPDVDVTERNES